MLKCRNPMLERLSKPKPRPQSKKVCFKTLDCTSTGNHCICVTATTPKEKESAKKEFQIQEKKSVTFDENRLIEIFEFEDDHESKSSRKVFWELAAIDRIRFKDRVKRIEGILSPILSESHRSVVFVHRMQMMQMVEEPEIPSSTSAATPSCPQTGVEVKVDEYEMVVISPDS